MNSTVGKVVRTSEVKPHPITQQEVDVLVDVIRAMDVDELEIVVANIPIEMCFKRVENEIKKYKAFAEAAEEAIDILKSGK